MVTTSLMSLHRYCAAVLFCVNFFFFLEGGFYLEHELYFFSKEINIFFADFRVKIIPKLCCIIMQFILL